MDDEGDDSPSRQGRYSWCIFKSTAFPCLYKSSGERYLSTRMVERTVMVQHLERFKALVFRCADVESLYATEPEVELLNKINSSKECNTSLFGPEPFTRTDTLVRYENLLSLEEFLENVVLRVRIPLVWFKKFGFIFMDNHYVFTYVQRNDEMYVPLFSFTGNKEYLRSKCILLEKWDAAYLKFCCAVMAHNYEGELFPSGRCLAVKLEDVKRCLAPRVDFDLSFWPIDLIEEHVLRDASEPLCKSWLRAPIEAISASSSLAPDISQTSDPTSVVYLDSDTASSDKLMPWFNGCDETPPSTSEGIGD